MEKIMVRGGKPLFGEVTVGGSKNAALPVLFAGILTRDTCVFANLPRVSDVLCTLKILRCLGARVFFYSNGDVAVDYRDMHAGTPPLELTGGIRGSVYLLGALLGRFGRASLAGAGGCNFGARPIDQHLRGFSLLGAEQTMEQGTLTLTAKSLTGCTIELAMPSVGATANLMMAATAAAGETVIGNAAAEPHVAALSDFLTAAGADVRGIGTGTVRVFGGTPLHGCRYTVIPDMIEAGTYLAAVMAAGGAVTVRDVLPLHLGAVLETLADMGAELKVTATTVRLTAPAAYDCAHLVTGPYPAFPTDLHPQFAALFCVGGRARGAGHVRETVWKERFRYTEELEKMGACVLRDAGAATFLPAPLHPATVEATDLRGGAALLIAALATAGETVITGASAVGRGYEKLQKKCRALGADVRVE